ncbi:recombinase family protein [Streptomyces sp. MS19]|uniref:recombinase family protein n=1 Tax=Streptomyces sp. MS19 TaxID=3385972 RepID=UPI0039A3BF02
MRETTRKRRARDFRAVTPGEPAAIYCRISKADDDDQTGVDRQERLCLDQAERLQLSVEPGHIYKDNNKSAWQRSRKRPKWDALLKGMEAGKYRHVIVYHADRLMRQPHDLERLLSLADDKHVILHGQANNRDLSNADDRFILRIEVAQACKSSDDTSRRVRDALEDRFIAGLPHSGRRQYGYTKDGKRIIQHEAEIIKDVFRLYLEGRTPAKIARTIHQRGELTSRGKEWQADTVRNLLQSQRVAGIISIDDGEIRMGAWPAIVDLGTWREVQAKRATRSVQEKERCAQKYYYKARGVITCTCGVRMGGSSSTRGSHIYRCARSARIGEKRCTRTIGAEAVEKALTELSIRILERLDPAGVPAVSPRSSEDVAADEADRRKLGELHEMWLADEITRAEFVRLRKKVNDRIAERQVSVIQRPVVALEGLTGPGARAAFKRLEERGEYERINAVFSLLFEAVIIKPATRKGTGLDLSRLEIRQHLLSA